MAPTKAAPPARSPPLKNRPQVTAPPNFTKLTSPMRKDDDDESDYNYRGEGCDRKNRQVALDMAFEAFMVVKALIRAGSDNATKLFEGGRIEGGYCIGIRI